MESTNKENKYVISFCIPEYNCIDGATKLVKQLLLNTNSFFQVVVVDDCSTDGTYEQLLNIKDNRLKIVRNRNNIGAKRNWYKSLMNGDGDWLYLVMGRDKLDGTKIDNLISIVDGIQKTGISYLKDSDEKKDDLNSKFDQIERLISFGDHPTGSIYNRKKLLSLGDKEHYFQTDFDYPESLLVKDIIKDNDGQYINSGVFIYEVNIDKKKVKSNFTKNSKILFYYPQKRIEQCITIIEAQNEALQANNLSNCFETLLVKQFRKLLSSITIEWIFYNIDDEWTSHYNQETRLVGVAEIISNERTAYKEILSKYYKYLSVPSRLLMICYSTYYLLKSIFRIIKLKLKH